MPDVPDEQPGSDTENLGAGDGHGAFSDEFLHALSNLQFHTSHLSHAIRRRYRTKREPLRPGELEITKLLESYLIVKVVTVWEAWQVFVGHLRSEVDDAVSFLRTSAPLRAEVEARLAALREFRQRWVAHGQERGAVRPEIPTEVLRRHPFLTDSNEILYIARCTIELAGLAIIHYRQKGADLEEFQGRSNEGAQSEYAPRFAKPEDLEEPLESLVGPARAALGLDPTLLPLGQPTSVIRRRGLVIKSVRQFLDLIEGLRTEWRRAWPDFGGGELWFRGHEDADWPLDPPLLREPYAGLRTPYPDYMWRLDNDFCARFQAGAKPFLEREPVSIFEWLCVMHDHEVPTRLLAWTESALAGLYFACRRYRMVQDAAVWILQPRWLGTKIRTADEPVILNHDCPSIMSMVGGFGETGPGDDVRGMLPVPVMPPALGQQSVAQAVRYTLHGFRPEMLEGEAVKAIGEDETPGLVVCRVPYSAKGRILGELHTLGTDEHTLFPDAMGLSRRIRMLFGALGE